MNSVYIVRSGQYDGNIGMTIWMNVRVFTSYEVAEAWVESEKLRDKTFNENFDWRSRTTVSGGESIFIGKYL
jgi:hypothetical protein